ncbi:MAG: PIG-L family deacetylase, partial [Paludibacteraceae bacterium]|nr:PIG-L family deacetylase [Paludibacteraceae bacterium]
MKRGNKNIVCVIAVHPDDETLGCGGTILKHLKNGDEVHCVFVTDGDNTQKTIIAKLADFYHLTGVISLGFEELKLADISLNVLVPALANVLNQIKPNILYIPNRSDAHSDHRAVFEALVACTKSFRFPFIEQILMCEVISETDFNLNLSEQVFNPNYFVDITDQWV